MFAVVSVGGRQFKVRPGALIRAPRMKAPLQGKVSLPVLAIGGLSADGEGSAAAAAQAVNGPSGAKAGNAAAAAKTGGSASVASAINIKEGAGKAGEASLQEAGPAQKPAESGPAAGGAAWFAASKDGLKEAQATALTLRHGRGSKILVFKKKRRKGYRRTKGFRESYTDLLVLEIKLPSGETLKAPANQIARAKSVSGEGAAGPAGSDSATGALAKEVSEKGGAAQKPAAAALAEKSPAQKPAAPASVKGGAAAADGQAGSSKSP